MAYSSLLSLSKSKLSLPLSIVRRGYTAIAVQAEPGSGKGGCMGANMMGSKVEDRMATTIGSTTLMPSDVEASKAWVPDPLTGYYRPGNWVEEIDPVDLRQMLLIQKVNPL